MKERIVLDEKSFKALSADSRVGILKSLNERRRTLSELSQKLNLGNSTIKEHCDILVNADLIKQIDEGRKWKYYELTQKGKQIISPNLMEEVKVLILLCTGVFLVGGFVLMTMNFINNFDFINTNDNQILSTPEFTNRESSISGEPMLSKSARGENLGTLDNQESINYSTEPYSKTITNQEPVKYSTESNSKIITPEFYATSILVSLIMGIIIGWIFLRKV
ncbi:MAG: winged helix-turn-helix domain-containing protein [Candidatus Iainarchaeum sp.]|jgi:predicted transcriptional regulator|nr:MAG: Helix-turn-helix domain protein [archaeon ADurb.Bin336]